ncbi:hypothetical protein UFOVP1360_37 [uncultured Caudovirales phage]|uniref:UmuC domain-containing protein n=1 Tax=uncultured Caudovirales phage TaxID=2100421 RepID=A0A6J5S2T6_9CAUD|nr:hypothetical protein UFOVP1360_37 [uncultured Caudovirales phage]
MARLKREHDYFSLTIRAWLPPTTGTGLTYAEVVMTADRVAAADFDCFYAACEYVMRCLENWHLNECARVVTRGEMQWVIVAAQAWQRRN